MSLWSMVHGWMLDWHTSYFEQIVAWNALQAEKLWSAHAQKCDRSLHSEVPQRVIGLV